MINIFKIADIFQKTAEKKSFDFDWGDVEDAIEHYNHSVDKDLNKDDFDFGDVEGVGLEELDQYDDVGSWCQWEEGELKDLDEEELYDELVGYRGSGWTSRARDMIENKTCKPIVVVKGKETTCIGDGRGRVSLATGMGWERVPVMIMTEKGYEDDSDFQ